MEIDVKMSFISIFYLSFVVFKHDFFQMRWFYPYRTFKHSIWWRH